jgi:hypothetical protein
MKTFLELKRFPRDYDFHAKFLDHDEALLGGSGYLYGRWNLAKNGYVAAIELDGTLKHDFFVKGYIIAILESSLLIDIIEAKTLKLRMKIHLDFRTKDIINICLDRKN